MKRSVLCLSLILGLSLSGLAQQEELRSAAANIEKKDFIAALDDIGKAKKKVNDLMTEQLASVLPATFGEFEMTKDDMGYGMQGDGVSMNKVYRIPAKAEEGGEDPNGMPDPTGNMMGGGQKVIMVEITTNMMMASEVQMAHSKLEGGMSDQNTEAIRIGGYRAIVKRSDDLLKMGMDDGGSVREEAAAIVGGAFIRVTVEGVKEAGQAKAFLEKIDFEKLVGLVGK